MAQENYPIKFRAGTTYTRTFTVTIDGVPWNFTGYTAAMQVRQSFDSVDAVLTLTNFDGITLADELGEITVTIAAEVSAGITPGDYVYDLEVEYEGVVTQILPTAAFTLKPAVTRG